MAPVLYKLVVPEPYIQGKVAFAIRTSLFVSEFDLLLRSTRMELRKNPQNCPNPASAAAIPGRLTRRPTAAIAPHRLSTCPSRSY